MGICSVVAINSDAAIILMAGLFGLVVCLSIVCLRR